MQITCHFRNEMARRNLCSRASIRCRRTDTANARLTLAIARTSMTPGAPDGTAEAVIGDLAAQP